jgi:hypothetical protein
VKRFIPGAVAVTIFGAMIGYPALTAYRHAKPSPEKVAPPTPAEMAAFQKDMNRDLAELALEFAAEPGAQGTYARAFDAIMPKGTALHPETCQDVADAVFAYRRGQFDHEGRVRGVPDAQGRKLVMEGFATVASATAQAEMQDDSAEGAAAREAAGQRV